MKCDECKWDYPDHMLNVLSTNVKSESGKMTCGICALTISNRIHGINRAAFYGATAEYLRKQAVRWRERNPDKSPNFKPEVK